MKPEDLFEAIGAVSDDLLTENNAVRSRKRRFPIILRAAACAAVIVGCVLFLPNLQKPEQTYIITDEHNYDAAPKHPANLASLLIPEGSYPAENGQTFTFHADGTSGTRLTADAAEEAFTYKIISHEAEQFRLLLQFAETGEELTVLFDGNEITPS